MIAKGLLFSVTCAEDLPYITGQMMARETAAMFLGDLRIREQKAACAEWVRDPVTPPEFGERVASRLPNSRHLAFPQASHAGEGGLCGRNLLTAFVEQGSAAGLDVSCVDGGH